MDSIAHSTEESSDKDGSPFLDFSFFPVEEDTASFPRMEGGNFDIDYDLSETFSIFPTNDDTLVSTRKQLNQDITLDGFNSDSDTNISDREPKCKITDERVPETELNCNTHDKDLDISCPQTTDTVHEVLCRNDTICGDSSTNLVNCISSPGEDVDIASLLKSIEAEPNFEMYSFKSEIANNAELSECSKATSSLAESTSSNITGQLPLQDEPRIKHFQEEMWSTRYKELLLFVKEKGHASVPHTYPRNQQLARWVKRQRRQYKLWLDGKPSTVTAERLALLHSIGFVWDSHDINWREKLDVLEEYRRKHGHVNVPTKYEDRKLAIWVKCQRRQYKLYMDGKPSAMTPARMLELERKGFEWEIRTNVTKKISPEKAASAEPKKRIFASSAAPTNVLSIDSAIRLMHKV